MRGEEATPPPCPVGRQGKSGTLRDPPSCPAAAPVGARRPCPGRHLPGETRPPPCARGGCSGNAGCSGRCPAGQLCSTARLTCRAWGDQRVRFARRRGPREAPWGWDLGPGKQPWAPAPEAALFRPPALTTSPLGSRGRPSRRKGCAGVSVSVHVCAQDECEHAHAWCVCMCASHAQGWGFGNTPHVVFVLSCRLCPAWEWSVCLWPCFWVRFMSPTALKHQKSPCWVS